MGVIDSLLSRHAVPSVLQINRKRKQKQKKRIWLMRNLFTQKKHNLEKNMLSLTAVIIVLFLTVLYYYLKYVYFTLRGPIPGIPPQFLFGNLLQTGIILGDESLANVLLKLKIKFGDVFQYWFTYTRVIIVSSLEDIQHIFAHRHVYDQGDIFIDKLSIVNSSEVAALKG